MAEAKGSQDWERLAQNLRVERGLLAGLDVLSDIPIVVFKGGALTRRLYGDLRKRASADNDLMVRHRDAGRALDRLLAHGYQPAAGLDAERALARTGQVALFPGGDFDAPSLDLHAEPFSRNFFQVDEDYLWSRLEVVDIHGRSIPTFDAPLALTHMVAHFFQHLLEVSQLQHIGWAWDRFGRELDRAELVEVAERTSGVAALEYALGLAAEYGFVRGPRPECSSARARLALRCFGRRWLESQPRGSARGLVAVLVADPARLPRALGRGLFPEQDELTSIYGEGSPVSLLFQHWRHRIFD